MTNLLLLYDTKEKDFARDIYDLLNELNIGVLKMIPLSPDKGMTLDEKEKYHFESADGAIFIITPGSERLGELYPSPSVSHEMGQAKIKFRRQPENVVYLVDGACKMPSIDQSTYVQFQWNNTRSIISALTQIFKNLKDAGIYRLTHIPRPETSTNIDIKKFTDGLELTTKKILLDISNRMNGYIDDKDLKTLLITKHSLTIQQTNLILRDLEQSKTVNHQINQYFNSWTLTDLGWEVIRQELNIRKEAEHKSMLMLAEYLSKPIKSQ